MKKAPVTSAVRALRAAGVDYEEHLFDYQPGGAVKAAEEPVLNPQLHDNGGRAGDERR